MRPQPVPLKRLLSRTFPNGATSWASAGAAATLPELTGRWPARFGKSKASFGSHRKCAVGSVKTETAMQS